MTQAEWDKLLTTRIAEATTAYVAAQQNQPNQQGYTYKAFLDCKPHTFMRVEGAVNLLRWIEKVESVFAKSKCLLTDRVQYATGSFEGEALTWWNSHVQMLGLEDASGMNWEEFKELPQEEYCPRDGGF